MDEEKKALLEKLFKDYGNKLYITARRRILNPDGARDVVLEVFLTAAEKADELYNHPNKPAWLYKTLNNKIMEACRKKYVTDIYSGEKQAVVFEPLEDIEGRIREIPYNEEGFDKLFKDEPFPEYRGILKDREIDYITYKFRDGLSVKEIAERMNISYTNSATMWWSIKKKLKKKLSNKKQGGGD